MAASLPSNDFLKKKSIWNREEGILQFLSLPVAGARDKGGFCGAAQFFNISAISYTGWVLSIWTFARNAPLHISMIWLFLSSATQADSDTP